MEAHRLVPVGLDSMESGQIVVPGEEAAKVENAALERAFVCGEVCARGGVSTMGAPPFPGRSGN